MPKKACCCGKISCCAPYNYTNNVAMLGDLLIEEGYKVNSQTGDIELDPVTHEPILDPKLGVYPIHPDDELILFQRPGKPGQYGGGGEKDTLTFPGGCRCCYGSTSFNPLRSQTIRQKYKNIGCAWTWYPPKYALDGNPTIPQCVNSTYRDPNAPEDEQIVRASDCPYSTVFPGTVTPSDIGNRKCESCSQIIPYTTQAEERGFGGNPNFDIWGDTNASSDKTVPAIGRAHFSESGWLTQYTAFLYPDHPASIGANCCACNMDPRATPIFALADASVSCWNKVTNGNESPGDCYALGLYRTNGPPGGQGIHPLRTPKTENGNVFYSPLQGRTNSVKNSRVINLNETFEMGKNTELGSAYFIKQSLVNSLYTPSSGGYDQNDCNFCASSPYLRRLMKVSYPWAFDIFCGGGGDVGAPAKTYDIGRHFIKTNLGDYGLYQSEQLHVENIGSNQYQQDIAFKMEQYTEMMGESTFFSQFIGIVHLEHYFHYMGTNLNDVEAAGTRTIPPGVGFGGTDTGNTQSAKDRWGYWLTRTTPKVFTFKSSGTPLFHFDLVYADRLGIFKAFADPDRSNELSTQMTIERFLSYFSMYSNSVLNDQTPDLRGKATYPPGCGPGFQYVQIIRDILGAMCEAGIIGTRDHRENIYNEIKQIIETGIQNGRNGAYYKPWAPGNPMPVTPDDFDKLYNKYYRPNMRMCTPAEMFSENGLNGLSKFGPIRKIIPPSLLAWEGWQAGEDVPGGNVYMYKEHGVNPNDIFKEGTSSLWNCRDGSLDSTSTPLYKIQDLQFSKYYNNGSYSESSPGYVNRQLFFRAVPGEWKLVKWGSLCLDAGDCEQCLGETPCSPFNLYGYGPVSTFNPENLWHSNFIINAYYPQFLPGGGPDPRHNNILALCHGIPSNQQGDNGCQNEGYGRGGGDGTLDPCGSGGICWDASGSPTVVRCLANCNIPGDSLCARSNPPCGTLCTGLESCSNFVTSLINNTSVYSPPQTFAASDYLCKDLYGITCCACIGKLPNDAITIKEWSDILFGQQKKCQSCGDACFVDCPDNIPLNLSFIPDGAGDDEGNSNPQQSPGGPILDSVDGENSGGGCLPCSSNTQGCQQLGVSPCDTNCGYDGFEYHPLCALMSQSNYSWGYDHYLPDTEEPCTYCECSGTNYCYARFGGKVQSYVENASTHFYSPQEDPSGNLYYTDNTISMPTPIHILKAGSAIAKVANTKLQCGTCGEQGDASANPFEYCICHAPASLGSILCPGALISGYSYYNNGSGQCVTTQQWCRYLKQSKIIIPKIKTSDIAGTYEY
jgi:hypothetical protein